MSNQTTIDLIAARIYDTYCEAVGGKAFNGDPLPHSSEFFNDLTKEKQANGYRKAAKAMIASPEAINSIIAQSNIDTNHISDGYHTFGELYEHRITNFLVLCRLIAGLVRWSEEAGGYVKDSKVWRSLKHSDGELAFGGTWFVLGIGTEPGKQITYHLPIEAWNKTEFAETLETAPEWDGHTSADVLERLAAL